MSRPFPSVMEIRHNCREVQFNCVERMIDPEPLPPDVFVDISFVSEIEVFEIPAKNPHPFTTKPSREKDLCLRITGVCPGGVKTVVRIRMDDVLAATVLGKDAVQS